MAEPPIFETSSLAGGYGRIPVLRGVELRIRPGEVVGVFGSNGMGKSTLIATMMGQLPATGGSIRFAGSDITGTNAHYRAALGISIVPQGRGIFGEMSVLDNLRYAWQDFGDESEEDAVEHVLEYFPKLRTLLGRQGGLLSGGEQQQLAFARALITRPLVLLLDEPTEGIQPSVIEEIALLIENLARKANIAIVLVEQRLDFIARLCDHIHVIEQGSIVRTIDNERRDAQTRIEAEVLQGRGPGADAAPPAPAPAARPSTPKPPSGKQTIMTTSNSSSVPRPEFSQWRETANRLGLNLRDEEIEKYIAAMEGTLQAYDRVAQLADNLPAVRYPRTPGVRPPASENKLNAWHVKCDVAGAPQGPLAGRKVVLKDNICLAGVPMLNGASPMEGYVPDVDATVASRILDAGGVIAGKANCEHYCLSGGSHTCSAGPVHNPYRMGYSSGGSSSGCGALVGAGEIDMAIGGDQGGSIRIPSCWCGCYGMKGTHGLVPYTGAFPIEATIDHLGPITTNVADNALLLEVIAGYDDGLDQRQYAPRTAAYTKALGRNVADLRIGVLKEGFGTPLSEADVDAKVQAAAARFKELGAQVAETSIPMHLDGGAIWTPITIEGFMDMMMDGNACGSNYRGLHVTSMRDYHASWRAHTDEMSPSLKACMLVGRYFLDKHGGHFGSKAMNISRLLRAAYDRAFEQFDLLLMPTLPMKATPIPGDDDPVELHIQRSFEMIGNTATFNCTGHPAMNVPCGLSEGLPVGMMLVGRHYDEFNIYRAASAFEKLGDWRSM